MVSLCHCLYQLWLFVVEGSHGEPVSLSLSAVVVCCRRVVW